MLQQIISELKNSKEERLPSDIEILRFSGRSSFLAFCMAVKSDFIATKFHRMLCRRFQEMYENLKSGKDVRAILEVQPQVGKSTIASILFPAWVLGKEAWPIICASYGSTLAERNSSECRDIVNSDVYQMIFPGTRLNPDTSAKDYWRTSNGGSYKAVGVGGGLTGFSGKILIGDDLFKDRAEADSVTVREATHKWFESVFMSRKQDPSAVILPNTRWHLDDESGHLQTKQKMNEEAGKDPRHYDQWQMLHFPAFAEEDEYIDGELFRRAGEVLCPERFSYDYMVKTRTDTEIYEWSSLYMQTPILKENAKFQAVWFQYYTPDDTKFKSLSWSILVDPASSKKKGADNTVIRAVGKERATGFIFLGEEIAGKLDPGQTVDALFTIVKQYPGATVHIEAVAYQATLEYWVREKQKRDQIYFNVEQLLPKTTRSKEARIEGLIPLYKARVIFHRAGGDDKNYETELLVFPQGKHDDRIDAVSYALDVMPSTAVVETPKQKEQRARQQREGFDPNAPFSPV